MMGKTARQKLKPAFNPSRINLKSLSRDAGKVFLALIAIGAVLSIAVIAPNAPAAIAELVELFERTPQYKRNRIFRRLQKQRLIEITEQNGETSITLRERGKQRVLKFNFDYLQLEKPAHWDGKWRIIAFDIPEDFAKARRALRIKMRQLGLYPLQKSVFVHPYPCRDEIDFVADFFGVGRYLNYIEATYIDDAEYLEQRFHLR